MNSDVSFEQLTTTVECNIYSPTVISGTYSLVNLLRIEGLGIASYWNVFVSTHHCAEDAIKIHNPLKRKWGTSY